MGGTRAEVEAKCPPPLHQPPAAAASGNHTHSEAGSGKTEQGHGVLGASEEHPHQRPVFLRELLVLVPGTATGPRPCTSFQ